jgi:hypothetical protein
MSDVFAWTSVFQTRINLYCLSTPIFGFIFMWEPKRTRMSTWDVSLVTVNTHSFLRHGFAFISTKTRPLLLCRITTQLQHLSVFISVPTFKASGITKWPRCIWFYCQDTVTAIKTLVTRSPALAAMCHGSTTCSVVHKWRKLLKLSIVPAWWSFRRINTVSKLLVAWKVWCVCTSSGVKDYVCHNQCHFQRAHWCYGFESHFACI